ncbi:MAG: hypothetical protein JRJ77_16020 [Deltaproteobacteria bacterium]|nr:hypothetical protein [Deltaproteobacteria bacterium]
MSKTNKLATSPHHPEDVEVLCHDLPSEAKVDGLLGLNFLRNFNIAIMFKEDVIEID